MIPSEVNTTLTEQRNVAKSLLCVANRSARYKILHEKEKQDKNKIKQNKKKNKQKTQSLFPVSVTKCKGL